MYWEEFFEPPQKSNQWDGHGLPFIRAALHIHARAVAKGHAIPLDSMSVAGERYGLSPALAYSEAIGDEPTRLSDRCLLDIAELEMPRAFAKLWETDVKPEAAEVAV